MFDRISKGMWWDQGLSVVEGCKPVNCYHCWAAAQTYVRQFNANHKIQNRYADLLETDTRIPTFNGKIRVMQDSITRPIHRRIPTAYAIWNDLFHEDVPEKDILDMLRVAGDTEHHVYFILTQRLWRAFEMFNNILKDYPELSEPLQNVAIGTTIRNKDDVDRVKILSGTFATCRVLSIEPLLESIAKELATAITDDSIHGIFLGGAAGRHPGVLKISWVREIRDLCKERRIPFFFKSWGNSSPNGSYNELDGRQWLELPKIPSLFKTFFFTFGYGHTPGIGWYTTIRAYNEYDARIIMRINYEDKWAFCYTTAEAAGVYEYNLKHKETPQ